MPPDTTTGGVVILRTGKVTILHIIKGKEVEIMEGIQTQMSNMDVFMGKLIDFCASAGAKILVAIIIYIVGKFIIGKLLKLVRKVLEKGNMEATARSYIINTFRSVCLGSRWKFAQRNEMCVILCLMQVAALIFTWSGWLSLLPVAANIASTIGGYTHNARKIRLAGMLINSPLWIIYDIIVGSWAGILDEAISELSMAISIWRYGWKELGETQE